MEYENEDFEDEVSSTDIETQIENENEVSFEETNEETGESNNGANDIVAPYNVDTFDTIALEETQYNNIISSISLLNHTNYILCALLLAVFIYLFLRDLFERRKV